MSISRAHAQELLHNGLAAAQSGDPRDRDQAEYYLEWVLRTDADLDQQVTAWYWLSRITDDPKEKRERLENALAIRPTHADARRDIAILDGRLKPEQMRIAPHMSAAPVALDRQVSAQETRRFRCPKCGASVVYNPAAGQLRCQFCGVELDGEGHAVEGTSPPPFGVEEVSEQDWIAAIYTETGHRWMLPQERVLACQGCGATVTFAPARVSAACAFCGSSYAIRLVGPEMSDLREPDGIALFGFDAPAAQERAREWLREQARRLGVPDDLPDLAATQSPSPVYLPFWSFDIGGSIEWSGYVSDDPMGISSDDLETGISVCGIAVGLFSGNYDMAARVAADMIANKAGGANLAYSTGIVPVMMDNELVPAEHSLPGDLLGKLEYDVRKAVQYNEAALADWPAEIYSVSMADASLTARERAMKWANQQIAADTGRRLDDAERPLRVDRTGLAVMSYKLLLLPVWVCGYTYQGETYRLLVNGQSGSVVGDVPRNFNPINRLF